MQSITLFLFLLTFSVSAGTFPSHLAPLPLKTNAIEADLALILHEANLSPSVLKVNFKDGFSNLVTVQCSKTQVTLEVSATAKEQVSTFYKGLRELGFLFPHPVRQISPTINQMRSKCGKTFTWSPTLQIRGFHLHTLHPSEWVHGFFMGKTEIAVQTIRWIARNGQNAFDVILMREPLSDISLRLSPLFELARSLGIHTGVSLGIATQQQKTYHLLNLWESLWDSSELVTQRLGEILKKLPLSYVVLEAGSSEFTPTDYERTVKWLNLAGDLTASHHVSLFTKVHVSSNQHDEKWGNFNFLPKFSHPNVGIWPHTVFFYGLLDPLTPIYGNKNFDGIRNFTLQEKDKRPTWYYPETGYWVGLDQDIPLLLTDYLRTRAEDMEWLLKNKIEGQVNFTTGHALGGWLFDWNLALMSDSDYKFTPTTALFLLGEDVELWKKHLEFQKVWFKEKQLIALLTSANLQDELSSHRIHDRFTMRELSGDHDEVKRQITLLEEGLKHWPSVEGIKDAELKTLLTVTRLRHEHALCLRRAFISDKDQNLARARDLRVSAGRLILGLTGLKTNYPTLPIFQKHKNPTSYQFGYVYPAASLYFWKREEDQVKADNFLGYFPFRNNIIDVFDILF